MPMTSEQSDPTNQQLLTTLLQAVTGFAQTSHQLGQQISQANHQLGQQIAQANHQQNQKIDALADQIAQANHQQNQKIDALADQIAQANHQQNQKIDALTDQIGKLSESVTALNLGLDDIKETTKQQAATAKIQAENVSHLIALWGKAS